MRTVRPKKQGKAPSVEIHYSQGRAKKVTVHLKQVRRRAAAALNKLNAFHQTCHLLVIMVLVSLAGEGVLPHPRSDDGIAGLTVCQQLHFTPLVDAQTHTHTHNIGNCC